jgi:predicted glycosyltransferase
MRILIDVGHPSDVHLFKNFYEKMSQKNHQILFTARDKEVTIDLLDAYNLNYIANGKPFKSRVGKLLGILKFDFQLFLIARKFKPDLFFTHGSFYASHVAFLMRKPFITFEDTGNLEQILLYKFFADYILTPDTFVRNLGKKHLRFKGTKELAYLHPNNFVPDEKVLDEIGIKHGERFVLLTVQNFAVPAPAAAPGFG